MATNGELAILIDKLERGLEREVAKREESVKYMKHVVEDVQARYADISRQMGSIDATLQQHFTEDVKLAASISDIFQQGRHLERLVWLGYGGALVIVIVFGAILSWVGR